MCFPSLYLKRFSSWQRQFLYLLFNNCQFGFVIWSRMKLCALSGWLCACLTLTNSPSVTARAASCHKPLLAWPSWPKIMGFFPKESHFRWLLMPLNSHEHVLQVRESIMMPNIVKQIWDAKRMIIFVEVLILFYHSGVLNWAFWRWALPVPCHQTCHLLDETPGCGSRLDLSQQVASLSTKCSEGRGCQWRWWEMHFFSCLWTSLQRHQQVKSWCTGAGWKKG